MAPDPCGIGDLRPFGICAERAVAAAGPAVAENPTLLISMGSGTAEAIAEAVRGRPAGAVLLYVAGVVTPPSVSPAADAACLVVPFDSVHALIARVSLLISLLPVCRIHVRIAPAQAALFEGAKRALAETIEALLENRQQDRNRGFIRLRSSLFNLPSVLRQGARLPQPFPEGASVVICGAGPSLSTHFEALRRHRERLLIIAVGHAVGTLVGAGIEPDAVVEVDAHAGPNWPQGLRPRGLLVACTEVAPDVAARFRDIVWCVGSSPVFNAAMQRHGIPLVKLRLGRSVTVTAIDFALRMGGHRLVLIGQDLCLAWDGRSHADGEVAPEGDERLVVPATGGGTVLTTRVFDRVRCALERYVRDVAGQGRAGAGVTIWNATPRGARIEGVPSVSFESFCEEAGRACGWSGGSGASSAIPAPAGLVGEWAALLDYVRSSDAVLGVVGRLRDALRREPMPMASIRGLQVMLQDRMADLLLREREALAAHWLAPVAMLVENVLTESPSARAGGQDPVAALDAIAARYAFAGDLARELAADLALTVGPAGGEMGVERPGPLESRAFRNHGLAQLRRMGGSLCERLEAGVVPVPAGLKLRWFNQYLPWVRIEEDGCEVALTAMTGMLDEARGEVDRFVAGLGSCPGAAVVFAGAGGWTHICEWARRFPDRSVAVLEPWPGVLAELVSHGCFLHLLADGSRVIDASDGADWRRSLSDWCEHERRQGRFPVVFPHSRRGQIPDLAALAEAATEVCDADAGVAREVGL